MKYTVAILYNNQLFHQDFPTGKNVMIASALPADIVIPNLKHCINICVEDGRIKVLDKKENEEEKEFAPQFDMPFELEEEQIALCITKSLNCECVAWLGDAFEINLGRKPVGKDGKKNDIVLPKLRYVSQSHLQISREAGKTIIKDINSKNGTFVNGCRIYEAELHSGDVISILTAIIIYEEDYLRFKNTVEEPMLSDVLIEQPQVADSTHELFRRSPRIMEQMPGGKMEIPAVPPKPGKPEINWLSTLLPAGVTIAIAVTMALAFQNTMMMLYSLPMTVAGVIISIVNYLHGTKAYKKTLEDRETTYLQKVDEFKADIAAARDAQKKAMLLANPEPEDCFDDVRTRSTRLWDREPNHPDFAAVRLGTGTVPFSVSLEMPRQQPSEGDELSTIPEEVLRSNSTIENMPILCDIRSKGMVGLTGPRKLTRAQIQNMIFHLATHHCNTELKLVCFYKESDSNELAWLADLPHTYGMSQNESYLASTQENADALFRSFTEMLRERKQELQETNSYSSSPLFMPYILFVFFEPELLNENNPINQYLTMGQSLGVGCLMAAERWSQLPRGFKDIINLSDDGGEIYNTANASARRSFCMDDISPALRKMFGQSIRPLYCNEGISVSSLPKSYTLYQMLGINSMSEFDIEKSWRDSDFLTSTLAPSAPIGVLESGEQLIFHSPPSAEAGGSHALVAGTNGSGKSEALLSIIISLALRYSPEEVSFLVIDFKGDSLAGRLLGLPHLRGIITSLDGDELQRSLDSINAEKLRRQRIFKDYNDNHPEEKEKITGIRTYASKYRQGKVREPLPHLFIVVDEFAEMKKDKTLSKILDDFISTASTGRSLGIHLILATQSPSGIIDSKIRANILKQLCLKVANTLESRDVIGSDLAAHINNSGRGYLKIGDNLQMFQSAYGSGKIILSNGSESTQIREAIDAIATYCNSQGMQKLPDIFCPPLPKRIGYPENGRAENLDYSFGLMPIGIRDDPARQFMGEYTMDIFSRNTLIVGSQGTGKTNLLQTILHGVADNYSPAEVNVYIMEFASLFLKKFELLPHVGGVVVPSDTDKIVNLFNLLEEQKSLRRKRFMEVGVSNYIAYRELGNYDLPQILVLVDNLAAAREFFPRDNDPLLSICQDGPSLGISVVATAAQPVGTMNYLPAFGNRIALYNNDPSVYGTLNLGNGIGGTKLIPKCLAGRCLVAFENSNYMCQSYLAFDSQEEYDYFFKAQTEKANGKKAMSIPVIPEDLKVPEAFEMYPDAYQQGRFMVGMDYSTVKPLPIMPAAMKIMAVSGRERDVRNFQRYMLLSAENATKPQPEYYIIDSIGRTLQPYKQFSCVKEYSIIPEKVTEYLQMILIKAEDRYRQINEGNLSVLDNAPALMLMLNSSEAISAISSDNNALTIWRTLTGKLKAMNICIVFGALENATIPFGSEVLKMLKENCRLVFFEELGNMKICDLQYATIKRFSGTFQEGDGYMIIGNNVSRIRVPKCPSPDDM